MAEQDSSQEKTEEPTARRLEKSREEGQVPRSERTEHHHGVVVWRTRITGVRPVDGRARDRHCQAGFFL